MKQFIAITLFAASLASCTSSTQKDTTTTTGTDTSRMAMDTAAATPMVSTPATTAPADATTVYTPAEGDVSYRNGKVMVWRNGTYTEADKNVELENGVYVNGRGEIVRNDEYVQLEDGQSVSRTGKFFNKTGNWIEDGWQGAKKGVRKAGEGIDDGWQATKKGVKKAAQKTGEAVKSVVE